MKNLFFLLAFITFFGLSSSKDYSVCDGTMSQKSIVCSACHGGAISADIFIIDGKLEEESSNDVDTSDNYVLEIIVPIEEGQSIQLFSSGLDRTNRLNDLQGNEIGALQIKESTVLYNLLALNNFRQRGQNFAKLEFSLVTSNLASEEHSSFVLQGVISNNDGTANGDQSFYQEITLAKKNPKTELVATRMFYVNSMLNVESEKDLMVSVFNLSGQEMYRSEEYAVNKLDLSFLPDGLYIAVAQTPNSAQKILKFIKE